MVKVTTNRNVDSGRSTTGWQNTGEPSPWPPRVPSVTVRPRGGEFTLILAGVLEYFSQGFARVPCLSTLGPLRADIPPVPRFLLRDHAMSRFVRGAWLPRSSGKQV